LLEPGWCGAAAWGGAYLEPVSTSLARLVAAFFRVEHFHHQAFAGGLDAFVEEDLDLFELAGVAGLGEGEFAFDFLEGVSHQLAPLSEGFLDDGLGWLAEGWRGRGPSTYFAVVEEHVECEDADFHFDVLDFDIFPFPRH